MGSVSGMERQRDKGRIDKAIAQLEEEMAAGGMEAVALGSRALVLLLERRSKLLGLDAVPATKAPENASGERDGAIVAAIRDEAQKPRLVK
jgi:hypothetical protein